MKFLLLIIILAVDSAVIEIFRKVRPETSRMLTLLPCQSFLLILRPAYTMISGRIWKLRQPQACLSSDVPPV